MCAAIVCAGSMRARLHRVSRFAIQSAGISSGSTAEIVSLKRSAEHSERRKSEPFLSAMSMLTFYINRAGDKLPHKQRTVLDKAKDELRIPTGSRCPRLRRFRRDA